MDDHRLKLRVIYRDLPDMVELGSDLRYRGWTAESTAYASPHSFAARARELRTWLDAPIGTFRMEAGADTGIGWVVMEFYTVDRSGHFACALTLATQNRVIHRKGGKKWRVAIEMETELGLVEQFARQCIVLGELTDGEAVLAVLP